MAVKYELQPLAGGDWKLLCSRDWSDESLTIPADEGTWASGQQKRLGLLFRWHRDFGLERRTPHPMGKDLPVLKAAKNAAHAERYRKAGMEVPKCYLPTVAVEIPPELSP